MNLKVFKPVIIAVTVHEYEPSDEGYNIDLAYQDEGPLQLDSDEEFFKFATNESDSIDDLPMDTYETVPYNH